MKNIKHFEGEMMHITTLASGMKCYFIPKKGFVEKQAAIAVNYGSVDNEFKIDGKKRKMPAGIAHYLEHKLFEEKDVNVFDKFSKLGATVNAFTSPVATAYYFNCTDNFNDCLKLLIDFVGSPYFTDENVEKERGIIEQEISMYKDDPAWTVYLNMLEGLYHNINFKENIAGSEESIAKITKELLLECYESFYTPDNMAFVCCGDLEAEDVFRLVEENLKQPPVKKLERILHNEPSRVNKKELEVKMRISQPLFYIGYKDNDYETGISEKTAAIKTLLDCAAGESSSLYEKLFDEGLINNNFMIEYVGNKYFSNSIISGFSKKPQLVCEMFNDELKRLRKNGLPEARFERIKRKHNGRYMRSFNSIDTLSLGQVDYFTKQTDIFEAAECFQKLDISMCEHYLHEHLTENNMAMSVVTPC